MNAATGRSAAGSAPRDRSTMVFLALLVLVPVPLLLEYVVHPSPLVVFAAAVAAILPLAEWMRRATEQAAHRTGSAIGGLLNVTFGNAAELILALFILKAGHADVVKAQITGSIIGNSLLGLGLAVVAGTWGRERQSFNRDRAGLLGSLLILAVVGLLVPALFDYTEGLNPRVPNRAELGEHMSFAVSVVLIVVYLANLVYSLVTHRDVFSVGEDEELSDGAVGPRAAPDAWPMWKSITVLVAATLAVAWEAELVSGALEATSRQIGLSTFFLGIIPLAVIGNAAEYISAVYFARQNQMGLVMTITVGSTIQVALFVAPLLVLISPLLGTPMTLIFSNPLELIAIAAVAFSVNAIANDGETTWFEGVLLLAVYAILGIAFYYVTP
jgi:Ca2+:H+ antiporter